MPGLTGAEATRELMLDPGADHVAGRTLCASNAAITPLMTALTPGDVPNLFDYVGWGPNFGLGTSAQSVHPNESGANLYSQVANTSLRAGRQVLSGTIVGGDPTRYYATARLHQGGPASLNVTNFSACGQEIRFGLRRGTTQSNVPYGTQDTNTLSWTAPYGTQTFKTSGSSPTITLLSGWYAVSARLISACAGGANQPWSAELYW